MSVRVALMRHGETDWNRAGRLQGRVDRPLTPEARAALARLAPPPEWRGVRCLASPLRRARQTAARLWPSVETDPRLVELDWGAWEGRRGRDLLDDPASGFAPVERWGWDKHPPGGESPSQARTRLLPLLADLAAAGEPAAIVAHRGLIRVIFAMAWSWDFDRPEPFEIKRDRLYPLTLDAEGRPHAPEPAVRLEPR